MLAHKRNQLLYNQGYNEVITVLKKKSGIFGNSNVVNGGRVLYKAVRKDKFWMKTNFPAQIIKLHLHSYLDFINLKKMSSSSNKKSAKNTPNKNSKENSSVITGKKIEEILEQKFKSYEENIKSYLAANNELLS